MSARSERCGSRSSWAAALLGLLALEMVAVSCAGADESDLQADDAGGGVGSDDAHATNDAAADPDGDPDARAPACAGFDWCPVQMKPPEGLSMAGIWGSGANDVWIVGAAGSVNHWDGQAWTFAQLPTKQSLQAVWGTGPNDVWAVSTPNVIFRTTGFRDGAAEWSSVTGLSQGPVQGILRAIWGTTPSDVWIAGDAWMTRPPTYAYESAWRTDVTDDGAAWVPVSSLMAMARSIWGSGPEDVWLVGTKMTGGSFAAHTNGVAAAGGGIPAWMEIDTQSSGILHSVWGSGPGDVWTVGDSGVIRHFTAGAKLWSVVESPTTNALRGLWGSGPSDVWAVGDAGTILHYDGKRWLPSKAAFPAGVRPDLHAVWGSGPTDIWAVGRDIVMHFSGAESAESGANP